MKRGLTCADLIGVKLGRRIAPTCWGSTPPTRTPQRTAHAVSLDQVDQVDQHLAVLGAVLVVIGLTRMRSAKDDPDTDACLRCIELVDYATSDPGLALRWPTPRGLCSPACQDRGGNADCLIRPSCHHLSLCIRAAIPPPRAVGLRAQQRHRRRRRAAKRAPRGLHLHWAIPRCSERTPLQRPPVPPDRDARTATGGPMS